MGKFDNAADGISLFSQLKNADPEREKREAAAEPAVRNKKNRASAPSGRTREEKPLQDKPEKAESGSGSPAPSPSRSRKPKRKNNSTASSAVPNITLTVEKNQFVPHTVRFEKNLYDKIHGIAENNGLSINRTIQILLEQAIELLDENQ